MGKLQILISCAVQSSCKESDKFWDRDSQEEHFHYCQHNWTTICTMDYLEAMMNVWGRMAGILSPGLGRGC